MKHQRVSVIVLIANTTENRDHSQGQGPIVAITVQNIQWKTPLLWGVYRLYCSHDNDLKHILSELIDMEYFGSWHTSQGPSFLAAL